jgi:hypothetical protein
VICELPSVAFEYALLCDDVRREDNGKFIFIGIYANSILLPAFPSTIRLRLVTRLHPRKKAFALSFRLKTNGEAFAILKGSIASPALESETSPTPEMHVEFKEAGKLEVEVSDAEFELENADSVDWRSLYSIPVAPINAA